MQDALAVSQPERPPYHSYGACGIKLCDEWRASFAQFLAGMGLRPEEHTLDRKNSNGGYCYGNCSWVTAKVQNWHSVTLMEFNDIKQSLQEWAEELGIKQTMLAMRLKKMSVEEAFTTPVAS